MRILVTGDKGFIGSNLKRVIESDPNYNVFGLDEKLFQSKNWRQELELFLCGVYPLFIFHVGACSDTLNRDVEFMMKRNWEATTIISDWAAQDNIPVVYSSTAALYGDSNDNLNLYAWSKYAGEKHVLANNQIALRYFNVYGPGEENKGKMSSVAYQTYLKYRKGEKVQLFPGRPTRDFIHVEDVVNANLHAIVNYEQLKGSWYDVGSGESNSFESVLDYLEIPYTYTEESQIPENYQYYTCASKQNFMPGWEPLLNLKNGIENYKSYLCKII